MKIKSIAAALFLIAIFCHDLFAASNQPYIYKSEVFYNTTFNDYEFTCYATNLEFGTIWVFQTNSDLLTQNWVQFGQAYYTGLGVNVSYNSADLPIQYADQVFFRMAQVGTNFTFYPGFESSGLIAYDAESDQMERDLSRASPEEMASLRSQSRNTNERPSLPSIDLIMPPVITNRFYH